MRGEKLQMSQNTDFHFAISRFRKYRFSFPFANCSKPSKHCFCVFCKSLKLVFFITVPNYYHVKISVDDHALYFLGKVPLHYI